MEKIVIKHPFYEKYIKRLMDIVISAVAMLLLWWVYAIVALLVKLNLGSPVIFVHERPGRIDPKTGKEKLFKLYKFRSMTNDVDENGVLLPNKQRMTKFGRILRASSMDELPELINILKGEMSFVGPRPLAVKYLPYYTETERQRHHVRPGLTGLAQVRGRNDLSWDEKFAFDVEYVNNMSFALDVRILFETVFKVLKREGIGQGEKCPVSLSVERAGMEQKTEAGENAK